MKMDPNTGCPLGISGNSRQSTGLRKRASALINPLFSPIFMNMSANMLGLDNAATPLGLKAMKELQEQVNQAGKEKTNNAH